MKESKALQTARRALKSGKAGIAKAVRLVQSAAATGDASAAYALATWHLFGKHVRKDRKKAVALLKQAAAENIAEALYDLAVCYEIGAGTPKDLKKAYEHYLRAAIWGDRQSIAEVGRCLFYGVGIRQNRRLARIWLDRAEALGVS